MSNNVLKFAVSTIALGMAVMLVAIAVLTGFQTEIKKKISGFGSHIIIKNRDNNITYETTPIVKDTNLYSRLQNKDGVRHVQLFATKPGIIKAKDEIQGIILKGVGKDFDWTFFKKNLTKGNTFNVRDSVKSDKIIISQKIASLLNLKVGDKLKVFFIQNPPRMRVFGISGIYSTDLEEFDKTFALCDIRHIQKINDWSENQISGYEIFINDFNNLDAMTDDIASETASIISKDGSMLETVSIKKAYSFIFDWLSLSDMNVTAILFIIILVSILNIIAGFLVLILEKTNMIGILKALGAGNAQLKKIFLLNGGFLILKGLLIGNLAGFVLLAVQHYFGIFHLDPEVYYVSTVPVNISISNILLLNGGVLFISILSLLIPAILISKVSPVKAINFN